MKTQIHIYDLDGTVIDSTHRYKTIIGTDGKEKIDLPFWLNNAHKASQDKLLPLAEQMQKQILDPAVAVIVATSRQMHMSDWLFIRKHFNRNGINGFVSRQLGDNTTKGADLKIYGIKKIIDALELSHIRDRFFYEDNIEYLTKVSEAINATPVYVPSKQGF